MIQHPEEELKIYNGVNWLKVNGVNKSVEKQHIDEKATCGLIKKIHSCLCIQTLQDGSNWPPIHAGVVTGATPKVVDGIDDISY